MREKGWSSRRIAVTVSVTAGIVLFVALGGVGLAQSTIALGQDEQAQGGPQVQQSPDVQVPDGKKVTVCHKARRAISISVNALPAHLLHGDSEGACIAAASAGATDEATAKKPKKTTAETDELAVTGKAKKQKKTKGASSGELGSTSAVSKPKKQKPTKAKGGHVSPPGLLGASPPGHVKQAAQGKGHGNGKNK